MRMEKVFQLMPSCTRWNNRNHKSLQGFYERSIHRLPNYCRRMVCTIQDRDFEAKDV
jgi:hypothetical protein